MTWVVTQHQTSWAAERRKPQEENYDTPVPEGDVDLASVKDFDQEQRGGRAAASAT